MSFWTNPLKVITNLLVKLGFKTSNPVVAFALPLLESLVSKYTQLAVKIVWDAVNAAEESGKSGPEKFEIAFDYIKDHFVSEGIDVVTSDINGLIEMAVQWLKKKLIPSFA